MSEIRSSRSGELAGIEVTVPAFLHTIGGVVPSLDLRQWPLTATRAWLSPGRAIHSLLDRRGRSVMLCAERCPPALLGARGGG